MKRKVKKKLPKDTGEFTPKQMAEYEVHHAIMERINAYRTKHGISWGGPPYSDAELAAGRGEG